MLLVGGLASTGLFVVAREREREQIQRDFERAADDLEAPLLARIDANLELLASIGRFYASSRSVEADEFARFTVGALSSLSGLEALAWLPRVPAAGLREYVARTPASLGLPQGYEVRRLDGRPWTAAPSENDPADVFPVFYVEPFPNALWGIDLGLDGGARTAMEQARDRAAASSTPAPALGAGSPDPGYFVFLALYGSGRAPESVAERRRDLIGFALSVLDLSRLMEASVAETNLAGVESSLVEIGEGGLAVRQVHP